MDFLKNKSKLRPDVKNKSIEERRAILQKSRFITEDLTPYRGKVFRFVREHNKKHNLFEIVTTYNGIVSCKINKGDKEWINITSSQDFIMNGIPLEDFKDQFDELL